MADTMENFVDSMFQDILAKFNAFMYHFGLKPKAVLLPLGYKEILIASCRYVNLNNENFTIFGMEIIETPTKATISQIEVV